MRFVPPQAFHLPHIEMEDHTFEDGGQLVLNRYKDPGALPFYVVTLDDMPIWEGYGKMRAHARFLDARRALDEVADAPPLRSGLSSSDEAAPEDWRDWDDSCSISAPHLPPESESVTIG